MKPSNDTVFISSIKNCKIDHDKYICVLVDALEAIEEEKLYMALKLLDFLMISDAPVSVKKIAEKSYNDIHRQYYSSTGKKTHDDWFIKKYQNLLEERIRKQYDHEKWLANRAK